MVDMSTDTDVAISVIHVNHVDTDGRLGGVSLRWKAICMTGPGGSSALVGANQWKAVYDSEGSKLRGREGVDAKTY
jgi:hypothetical protein